MSGGTQVARGSWWSWIVVTVAVVVAVGSFGWAVRRPPERVAIPVVEPDPADRAEIAALEEAVVEREGEIRALMEQLTELEMRLDPAPQVPASASRPSVALAECREERERLRSGLERAVEELNRRNVTITGTGGAPPAVSAPSPSGASAPTRTAPSRRSTGPKPYRKISSYADRIQIVGEKALVSGRLYNPDERDQRAEVELSLLRDGVEIQSRTQTVLVPGKGHLTVSDRLHVGGIDGTYTGRVRVLD
jgi:hypothetical protein